MKQNFIGLIALLLIGTTTMIACSKNDNSPEIPAVKATVVSGSGDISSQLIQFRALLGDQLNTTPSQTTGRREINWDAVPVSNTNVGNFPLDFFNLTDASAAAGRKRGLILVDGGSSFRVDSSDFSDIDASYAAQFDAFSVKKTFAYLGNTVTQCAFKIPGTSTDASIKGFGVVFSDVDDASATTIEFFNLTKSLGIYKVPVRSGNTSFSFLGVYFPDEKVTRVKITCGDGTLAPGVKDKSDGGSKDLVVMDDFFYDEPKSN